MKKTKFILVIILFPFFIHQAFSQEIKEMLYNSEVGIFLLNSIAQKGEIFSETKIRLIKQDKNIWRAEYTAKGKKILNGLMENEKSINATGAIIGISSDWKNRTS